MKYLIIKLSFIKITPLKKAKERNYYPIFNRPHCDISRVVRFLRIHAVR
jgi:hypothetical protein